MANLGAMFGPDFGSYIRHSAILATLASMLCHLLN